MYMCNMINRCAPHEKKKRKETKKKMVIQDAIRFSFPLQLQEPRRLQV